MVLPGKYVIYKESYIIKAIHVFRITLPINNATVSYDLSDLLHVRENSHYKKKKRKMKRKMKSM